VGVGIPFVKLHGAGNDYIYLDAFGGALPDRDLAELAREMSDRHFGVGGDGLIVVLPGQSAEFRMRMFNADGSEGEMCGNGMRGFAKLVYEAGYVSAADFGVETGAGIIRPHVFADGGRVGRVRVDMGPPRLERGALPMEGPPAERCVAQPLDLGDRVLTVTCVSMGNPHCVTFVDDVADFPVTELGPRVERAAAFPRRINAEFVAIVDRRNLAMRVWERGSGETLACGTGACASTVAAALEGRAERRVTVRLLGGELEVEWSAADGHVYLTGPAVEAFRGVYEPR
jgi:diaminopimelate epimerase